MGLAHDKGTKPETGTGTETRAAHRLKVIPSIGMGGCV